MTQKGLSSLEEKNCEGLHRNKDKPFERNMENGKRKFACYQQSSYSLLRVYARTLSATSQTTRVCTGKL